MVYGVILCHADIRLKEKRTTPLGRRWAGRCCMHARVRGDGAAAQESAQGSWPGLGPGGPGSYQRRSTGCLGNGAWPAGIIGIIPSRLSSCGLS